MPQKTDIEWTDYTSNPIRAEVDGRVGWHCEKVSAGCAHCYAEKINHRFGTRRAYTRASRDRVRPLLVAGELKELLLNQAISGKRVFVGDMTDLFGEWVPDEWLDEIFSVVALRPDVTFQVLTKRPARAADYFAGERWRVIGLRMLAIGATWEGYPKVKELAFRMAPEQYRRGDEDLDGLRGRWPLPNLWLGTSVEDQPTANKRIGELLRCPAAVRFLSCEPLLGPIDWHRSLIYAEEYYCGNCQKHFAEPAAVDHCPQCGEDYEEPTEDERCPHCGYDDYENVCPDCGRSSGDEGLSPSACWERDIVEGASQRLHQVIIGGESGPGARPCDLDWIRGIVQQCHESGVAAFVKQLGSCAFDDETGIAGPRFCVEPEVLPLYARRLTDSKGGDPAEWPADLRVREWPGGGAAR